MNILPVIFIALVIATVLLIWRTLGGRRRTIALYGLVIVSAGLTAVALVAEGASAS